MLRIVVVLFLFVGFTGCSSERLFVQGSYITHEDLASSHVGSPDSKKDSMWTGQELFVNWSLPKKYLSKPNVRLVLYLRFRNREQEVKTIPIDRCSGVYTYRLLNEDFFNKRGIVTYQAKIVAEEDEVLETWSHQLWTNLLEIELEANKPSER